MEEVTVKMIFEGENVKFDVSGDKEDLLHKIVKTALKCFVEEAKTWEKEHAGSSGNN